MSAETPNPVLEAQHRRDLNDLQDYASMFAYPVDYDEEDERGVWVPYDRALDLAELLERCRERLTS